MSEAQTERKSYHVMDATDRTPVEVAVGVLIERDAQGRESRFLLTSRPQGKVYAGYWEFPGGKLEAGETVEQALRRELHEEIGVTNIDEDLWKASEILRVQRRGVRVHLLRRMVFAEVPTPTLDVRRAVPCTKVEDAMCRGE